MQKIILSIILAQGGILAGANCVPNETPNIVFIMTDQQTATAMSCAGNSDLKTPNMDRLAAEGVRFSNAYCSFPLCTPSRASIFTGVMPSQLPVTVNHISIPDDYASQTLGHLLSDRGYECVYAGKWHLPGATIESTHGFLKIHDFGDIGLAESCVSFLKQKHDKPFFMVASFDNPHNICEYARMQPLPWAQLDEPPLEDCPNLPSNFLPSAYEADLVRIEQNKSYLKYPVINYSEDDWRRYRNAYYRLVEHVDHEIGKILDAISREGLEKNTVVIFTSDHGDGAGAHQWNQKSALFEEVVNIPLIVRLPTKENGGTVLSQLVCNGPDIFASICDWAKIDLPAQATGKSLKNLVVGSQNSELHDYVVTETRFDASDTWGWMVRTPQFKYVLYPAGRYREQLFDMKNDRGEQVNLVVENRYLEILRQHRMLLRTWANENKQPFLLRTLSNSPE